MPTFWLKLQPSSILMLFQDVGDNEGTFSKARTFYVGYIIQLL